MTDRTSSAATALPLTPEEVERLATYNAEVYRGLVHAEEYADEMAALQRRFIRAQRDEAKAKGWIIVEVDRG